MDERISHQFSFDFKGEECNAEFNGGVTNGAQWYDVPGGMQDFNYLHSNDFEITLELSCCKYPMAKDGLLQNEWDKNREALLTYMEMVRSSFATIKGVVSKLRNDFIFLCFRVIWE